MALAKDPALHDSRIQACSLLYGSSLQVSDLSSPALYAFDHYQKAVLEGGVKNFGTTNNINNIPSPLSSPSSANSNVFGVANYQDQAHSVINFKAGYDNNFMHTTGSLLSFDYHQNETVPQKITAHQDDFSIWENNFNNRKGSTNLRLLENFNSHQTATNTVTLKEKQGHGEETFEWFYDSEETVPINDSIQENGAQETSFHKRPHMGENIEALKKQCTSETRKSKPIKSVPSKDPQSIAAKNRRERISERLKTLQELVPNGSKVDLVTMLEKAISYVKFLQLQVKVLATDEFWPVQGGKAPEISQVKEAIDAILSSQRDRNSSSK